MHGDEGRRCDSFDIRRVTGGIEGSLRGRPQWMVVILVVGALWLLLVMSSEFEMEIIIAEVPSTASRRHLLNRKNSR